jgi:hypothetical protein
MLSKLEEIKLEIANDYLRDNCDLTYEVESYGDTYVRIPVYSEKDQIAAEKHAEEIMKEEGYYE